MSTIKLRVVSVSTLEAVVALDQKCFARPWTQGMWEDELHRHYCQLWGAWERAPSGNEELVGYSCAWYLAGEVQLQRVAASKTSRRRGIGRLLVQQILEEARAQLCEQVQLEVASSNSPAIALYNSFGFAEVGRRVGYYREPPDDAVLMNFAVN
ncbi:MAG: ribosomal protein S18-alanine N-acetyltransferase [Nannocystaceae bacterium]